MRRTKRFDRSRSLQELEGEDWGAPETAETPMIGRVLALRRRPLEDLSDSEVRLAVAQRVGLSFVLTLAIERLGPDPLLEADHYPGDLLAALARLDEQDWAGRTDLRDALAKLFDQAMSASSDAASALRESLRLNLGDRCSH